VRTYFGDSAGDDVHVFDHCLSVTNNR
jgi:hypothetical protein